MKIAMIGTGYVGLVSGVCFAEFGFDVTCVDANPSIIERLTRGEVTIFEPGLDDVMARNQREGRLSFSTDLVTSVRDADVVFLAVGTPSRRSDGEADLQYIEKAADQLAHAMKQGTVLVIKSTVVVGTSANIRDRIKKTCPDLDFSMVSNPEFLREGSAIEDFMRPDRVVVGVEDERGRKTMQKLYRPLYLRETPLIITSLENAELIKYAANAFLAMKVTFINQVADLCEKTGGNVQEVAHAIGMDKRIGAKFLHAGPGFGGSCFPKDTRAFAAIGQRYHAPQRLIETVITLNEERKRAMGERIIQAAKERGSQTVGILGVTFKPNTDDVRESPALDIIRAIQQEGLTVRAHDPEGSVFAAKILDDVQWCASAYEAAQGAGVLAIVTEWNAYRALDLKKLANLMPQGKLIDLRNIYKASDFHDIALDYQSLGR
ncbi:UDP-glucose dehydrogenase family protein [Bartonella tamiae]|uniref:UDP-glucose 6-dehydrogenase n=1 Tax=Bartonella tamiae Th239 TaxID=1094558 RepID=J0R0P5_9HYPH|nr:UDP-glucose/GDP-mannose dehydrogenase family protein [Bartonella tamiae]EJF89089.1 nucleotide sugar dehydrogenase [Bartonella tamiae Th239]EJF94661.1 nucleotide sugar dehydrogenase [Bartonella tamiae Th307]